MTERGRPDRTEGPGFTAWVSKPMSAEEFSQYSELISGLCGIRMTPSKKVMLEARLQKRLRLLGMRSFRDYLDHVRGDGMHDEMIHMLDAVTTNKTDFFREPVHFQLLSQNLLPAFIDEHDAERRQDRPFLVWSAGCSSGEEPYTLAMVLTEFAAQHPSFRFSILATDLSTKVLDRAQTAIYDADRVESVPQALKQKYLLRSRDPGKNLVRIAPGIRAAVRFQRLNLMEEAFYFDQPLDAIFCRNVIIYFDRATQERLLDRFCRVLRRGGHLFLGHSESIHGFTLPLRRIMSTVHQKIE